MNDPEDDKKVDSDVIMCNFIPEVLDILPLDIRFYIFQFTAYFADIFSDVGLKSQCRIEIKLIIRIEKILGSFTLF